MRRSIFFLILLCLQVGVSRAQITLADGAVGKRNFPLVSNAVQAVVCYDPNDAAVVKTAAELFAADVARVTGSELPVAAGTDAVGKTRYAVIVGTVGQSRWIDELAAAKKIDVAAIEGSWERYAVRLVDDPGHGLKRALVIAGSDRRGAAYGLMSLSRIIGVDAWYWWLDVPVPHRDRLMLRVDDHTSKTPSV